LRHLLRWASPSLRLLGAYALRGGVGLLCCGSLLFDALLCVGVNAWHCFATRSIAFAERCEDKAKRFEIISLFVI
jgi:hypothetical protein